MPRNRLIIFIAGLVFFLLIVPAVVGPWREAQIWQELNERERSPARLATRNVVIQPTVEFLRAGSVATQTAATMTALAP
jgi:hypothetical protein